MSIEDALSVIDKYYGQDPHLRKILLKHSSQVADLALDILVAHHLPLDARQVAIAAMLHDIGICFTHAPSIGCHGTEPYLMHGIIGAEIIRNEGLDDCYAGVAAHHTGAGITERDIIDQSLPLPTGDYCPRNLLEQLICYADKFYSKSGDMQRKALTEVRGSMSRYGQETLMRFEEMHSLFGLTQSTKL